MAQEVEEGGTLVSQINLTIWVISSGASGCMPAGGILAWDKVPGVVSRDPWQRTLSCREDQ